MATRQSNVVITANGKQAEAVLTAINERVKSLAASEKQLQAALKQMRTESKQDTDQYKQLQQELKGVQREMKSLNTAAQQNQSNMEKVNAVIKDLSKATTRQLRDALRAGKKELERMSASDKELKPLQQRLKLIQQQIDRNTNSVKSHGSAWQIAVKNITAYVGVFGLFNAGKRALKDIITLNSHLSDQMADIRKVSGLEMSDIEQLTRNLAKIDTRTTLEELNSISYAGAKLGFGEYGIEGLEQFTRAANMVNVALKEDLGDEALTALSKITENMGLIKKMGVEDAMLATGSAMFKLASSSTAAAGPIVEITKRIIPMAKSVGLATSDVLALASSADSLQLPLEVTGTALSKFIAAMQVNHNLIEKTLGIPAGTIESWLKQGKAMDTILLIFDQMKEKGNMSQLMPIVKMLGGEGSRLITVLQAMSQEVDRVRKHLDISHAAFKEGTAVIDEYNIQQETAQAYLERSNNLLRNAFVNPDAQIAVKEMTRAWYEFIKGLTTGRTSLFMCKTAVDLLIGSLKLLINILPGLLAGTVVQMLSRWVVSLTATKAATDAATLSWKNLTAVAKANWIGLLAGAITQLTAWMLSFAHASEEARVQQLTVNKAMADAAQKADDEIVMLGTLKRQLDNVNISQSERSRLLSKVRTNYDIYLSYLGIEIKNVKDLTKHYAQLAFVIKQRYAYEAREELKKSRLDSDGGKRQNRRVAGAELQQEAKNLGLKFNLEEDVLPLFRAGKSVEDVFRVINPKGKGATKVYRGAFSQATDQEGSALKSLLRKYMVAYQKERSEEASIDAAFADELKGNKKLGVGDWNQDQFLITRPTGEFVTAPDKEAAKAARAAALAEKKEMRQQLQESEAEAKAIVDNIKNFYERQITETLNIATATGMNPELQDQLVNSLTMRMNSALAQARKAVAGTKNDWEAFKLTIQDDMIEPLVDGTNESMQLLDKIENNNLAALRRQIAALSKSLNKPESALIDQVWKNATLNEKANAKMENKEEQRRRQAILEKNFTGKVNQDTETTMEQFGFAMLTPEQMKIILNGGKEAQQFLDERSREWQVMLANARENFSMLATTDNPADLFGILFGQDWESHKDEMKLRGLLDLTGEDFQLFYDELIKYNDAYVEAQKRAAERVVKINDYVFESRFDVKAIDDEVRQLDKLSKQQSREGGRSRDMQQRMGIADTMANDPELLRLALIEERERKHLEMMQQLLEQEKITMKEYNAAMEKYDSARAAHADKVAQSVSERIALLQQLTHPIEDFGTAVGDAFATMTTDAEEGRKALQDAVKSMIEQFGKMTIKMYAELMTQKMQQALFHQEMEAEDRRHSAAQTAEEEGGKKRVSVIKAIGALILGQKKKQKKQELKIERQAQGEQTDVVEEEGESRLDVTSVVETGIASITQKAAQDITQTKQSQAAANAATTAAETEGSVAAGVAGGAAKIIGTLGWWGIPLIAVITALLNGLLAFALGKLFGGSKSQNSSSSATNVKLKSGMLTYDSGNIHTVLGTDGRVYQARDEGTIQTGIVRSPITASVNGQPSIIGERGPELVVGRETTRAIMLSRPDILKTIADIDRNRSGRAFRTLDDGDLSALAAGGSVSSDSIAANNETMQQLAQTVAMLSQTLTAIQQRGIPAHINKYGRGGLIDEVQSGMKFMQKYQ